MKIILKSKRELKLPYSQTRHTSDCPHLEFVLNFQDFHPQEFTNVGILKNPVVIKILEHIEGEAYRHADHITVFSYGGIEHIQQWGADPENVTQVFNSVSLSEFNGLVQSNLDTVKVLQDEDIIFYIAGDGAEKGDVAGIRSAVLCLKEDASVREVVGSNGRRYLEKNGGKLVVRRAVPAGMLGSLRQQRPLAPPTQRSAWMKVFKGVIEMTGYSAYISRVSLSLGLRDLWPCPFEALLCSNPVIPTMIGH